MGRRTAKAILRRLERCQGDPAKIDAEIAALEGEFDGSLQESELVAGYHTEYSGMKFAFFYIAEYAHMVLVSSLVVILFFGGWLPPLDIPPLNWIPGVVWLVAKIWFFFFLFAMVKALVPRYRYDQLMRLGWKVFLPISLAMVIIVAAVLQFGPTLAAN